MWKRKPRFYVDPLTLTIKEVEKKTSKLIRRLFTHIFAAMIIGVAWASLFLKFFSSPHEKKLQREILSAQTEISSLQIELEKLLAKYNELKNKDNQVYRSIFSLPMLDEKIPRAGIGGADLASFNKTNDPIIERLLNTVVQLEISSNIQEQSLKELLLLARNKEKMLKAIPSIMPVDKNKVRISSGFGWRINPFTRSGAQFHPGIDFAGPVGIPIYATGDGVVIDPFKTSSMHGYGLVVVIDHGFGFKTLYAHLSKILVKPGDSVKRGQIIGLLGNSGPSTGPHLHYEVIRNNEKVNPINYIFEGLSEEEYKQILKEAEEGHQILS
ncbi:MAG: peptidoglycan DD-metalloendopeptidase family protein [Bacteroidales bacterium]|nr:peptidoglycan DD-metalloendopeptidase family protein [Bacteroidales bacterium]